MRIDKHRLCDDDGNPVELSESPNRGSKLDARYLVMHYTAGRSLESSVSHLCRAETQASAHLVIGRDGRIIQLVPFNRIAWHAGRSRWHNLNGLNAWSIGIELDNAGALTELPVTNGNNEEWQAWWGGTISSDQVVVAAHKFDGIERGWHRYTTEQLDAAVSAGQEIARHYGLRDVLGHDDIAPLRKLDPGPAFPLDNYCARVLGRQDEVDNVYLTTTRLNVRSGPGTDFPIVEGSPLLPGTTLRAQTRDCAWYFVDVGDGEPRMSGWVHGNYIDPT